MDLPSPNCLRASLNNTLCQLSSRQSRLFNTLLICCLLQVPINWAFLSLGMIPFPHYMAALPQVTITV